ncbi:MAG: glycoside hydrolase family 2 protein, partial [Limisphaerales bacterium]
YISTGSELCRDVKPGEEVSVPLWASFMTDHAPGAKLQLHATLTGWDTLGRWQWFSQTAQPITFEPWLSKELEPLRITMPDRPVLALLTLLLEDETGSVLQRNFTTFLVADGLPARDERVQAETATVRVIRFAPDTFKSAHWSSKQWNVMGGLKVDGAGSGYFEYRLPWPEGLNAGDISGASLVFEASAKQLFGKDKEGATKEEGDFMLGKGTHDPSLNPNSYPMTDTLKFPSAVRVRVSGDSIGQFELPDVPADHRGILSWHAQKHDRRLHEAGSYGYLLHASVPSSTLQKCSDSKEIVVRFEVDPSLPGGLAIYGARFGRYPVDPSLVFTLKQ